MWSLKIDDSYLNLEYIYFEQYHNFMFLPVNIPVSIGTRSGTVQRW